MKPETVNSVSIMSEMAKDWNYSQRIALVPTMGFLHEGHLNLVREASAHADKVIVSIFVNPLQFGPSEDLTNYPRNLFRDAQLLSAVGADIIFAPDSTDITPSDMKFQIDPGGMASVLCGRFRPGHFAGVSTIVAKLFHIVRPGIAVFGWKDAQQFLLLKKMVLDLNMPVTLHGVDIKREADGLAMSSRNTYLNAAQRKAAPLIYGGLSEIRSAYESGVNDTKILLNSFRRRIDSEPLLKLQYAESVDMDSLKPLDKVQKDNTLIAVAVYAGDTRLIDNIRL